MVQPRRLQYTFGLVFPDPIRVPMSRFRSDFASLLLVSTVLTVTACGSTAGTDTAEAGDSFRDAGLLMRPVNSELDAPWGMDFVDPENLLLTEQGGTLKHLDLKSGSLQTVEGVPASIKHGQGGLLDVMVGGDGWIYLSYAVKAEGGQTTQLARGRLRGASLEDVEILFTAQPVFDSGRHFGSRLVMADGFLYATVGDRGHRHEAQSLKAHNGTVIRLKPDGSVPGDNPFVGEGDALPEIWSYGHRNPQGMAIHPDGTIWVSEHGPQGGDELNRVAPGNNYGWPVITYGEEYGGGKIGEGTAKAGMEQPLKYYVPSIATAGIDFYSGDRYPDWKPSILVTALAYTHLNRVELDGEGLGEEYRYFEDSKLRFRDVQVGPDGYVYVLAGNGLYQVVPDTGG